MSGLGLVAFVWLVFQISTSDRTDSTVDFPEFSGVTYPIGYRTDFLHYATVQRPDGTIRDLYINEIGARAAPTGELPYGTIVVIEGFHAFSDENGNFITDEKGHYVRADIFPMVHVREKRSDWSSADFVSNARNGHWNLGTFEIGTGIPFKESVSACFHCHSTAPVDFLYSFPQLSAFAYTNTLQYLFCRTTGRTACE